MSDDTLREALELIAAPKRPDGTWNRDREACRQLAAAALAAVQPTQPVAWANEANLISARISRDRGGPFDSHTWSEGPTYYHRTPLYASPQAVPAVPQGWAFCTADFSLNAHESARNGSAMLVRTGDDYRAWFALEEADRDRVPLYVSGFGPTILEAISAACAAALRAARPQAEQAQGGEG